MSETQQTVGEAARCLSTCGTALRLCDLPRLGPSSAADTLGEPRACHLASVPWSLLYREIVGDRVNIPKTLRAAPGAQKALSSSSPHIQGDLKESGGVRERRAARDLNWVFKDGRRKMGTGQGAAKVTEDFLVSKCVFHDKS